MGNGAENFYFQRKGSKWPAPAIFSEKQGIIRSPVKVGEKLKLRSLLIRELLKTQLKPKTAG
ncbi:hypothetical protein [Methanosarcina siciliae]|uniref:hypothetical protein n=1 Tax=Methanosarcina siciliae TaxID=38027 RepID=UPI00064FF752|nr:hypothetical protein [Methanosarcina siciliae]